jgi:hypothetical protein
LLIAGIEIDILGIVISTLPFRSVAADGHVVTVICVSGRTCERSQFYSAKSLSERWETRATRSVRSRKQQECQRKKQEWWKWMSMISASAS